MGTQGTLAGGVTTLSPTGAQWRTLGLTEHCLVHAKAFAGFCMQGTINPERRAPLGSTQAQTLPCLRSPSNPCSKRRQTESAISSLRQ
jgi:hypothetical protein